MLELRKAPRQRDVKQRDKNKLIRDIIITVVVIIAVPVGVKLAYSWFTEQVAGRPLSVQYINLGDSSDTSSNSSVKIQYLSSPIRVDSMGALTVHATPGANCSISVDYGKHSVPMSVGLAPTSADKTGVAKWSWKVLPSTPIGTWPLTVTCMSDGTSAHATKDLTVIKN